MSSRGFLAGGVLSLAALLSFTGHVQAATSCDQQAAVINGRSKLLAVYKRSDDDRYRAFHKRWATRISYASQWVPKDAAALTASLETADSLHAATSQELQTQILAYKQFEARPLTCSSAHQALIKQKLADINGFTVKPPTGINAFIQRAVHHKSRRVAGGAALIVQDRQAETEWLHKDFDKKSETMLRKLRKQRHKHPEPRHPKTVVR